MNILLSSPWIALIWLSKLKVAGVTVGPLNVPIIFTFLAQHRSSEGQLDATNHLGYRKVESFSPSLGGLWEEVQARLLFGKGF